MSDFIQQDDLTLDEETRQRIIQQLVGRRQNLAGTGTYQLPVALQALQGVPIGIASAISPVEGGMYIPGGGLATRTYGVASDLVNFLSRIPSKFAEEDKGVKLPGGDAANALWQKNVDAITPYLDVVGPPQTIGQQAARTAGTDFGSMGLPGLPTSSLSAGARLLTGILAPNTLGTGATVANAALTGLGAGAITNLSQPHLEDANELGVAQLPTAPTNTTEQLPFPLPPVPPKTPPTITLPTEVAAQPNLAPVTPTDTGIPWTVPAVAAAVGIGILAGRAHLERFMATAANETVATRRARIFANEPGVQEFNSRVTGTPPAGTTPPIGEAPLPGSAGSTRTELQRQVLNENAVLNAYAREIFPDTHLPSGINLADEIRATVGASNNKQMLAGQVREIARTGVDPVTGLRTVSLQHDIEAPLAALSQDKRSLFNQASHYANELDNRMRLRGQPTDFPSMSTQELQSVVNSARAIPELDTLFRARNMLHDGLINIGERRGYFSPAEAAQLKNKHPNFLSSYEEATGKIDNPFTPRELGDANGLRGITANVDAVDRQHFQKFFEQMDRNDMQKFVIPRFLEYQLNNPGTAKVITPYTPPKPLQAGAKGDLPREVIAYRDNGIAKYVRVENPAIREALTGSTLRGNVMLGAMSALYREGTTGLINTLATGGVFPIISATRSSLQMATNTTAGAYKGVLDAGLRAATRGRVGLPFDPTAPISTASHALRALGAEGALHISEALKKNSQSFVGSTMRKMLGDTATNAISIAAQVLYNNTWRAQMKQLGLTGSSGLSSALTPDLNLPGITAKFNRDTAFRNWFRSANEQYSTLNRMTPEISVAHQWGGAAPWLIRTRSLVNDLFSSISEAGHQAFYAINSRNPNMSPAVLRYETAQLTGHPGTRGASQAVAQLDNATPFLNITKQGIARVGRQFNENPIAAAVSIGSMVGVWALGSILSAISAGPEAVYHLVNSLTTDQVTEGPRIYFPGQDPTTSLSISTEQTLRPVYAAALGMALGAFGITPTNIDGPHPSIIEALKDMFSKHITSDDNRRMIAAVSAAGPQLTIPGAQAVGAIAGQTPDINIRSMLGLSNPLHTIKQDLTNPIGGSQKLPGFSAGVTSVTGTPSGDTVEALMQAILGGAGTPLINQYKLARAGMQEGAPLNEILSNAMMEYSGTAKDKMAYFRGSLFPNQQARLARRTPLVERVQDSLQAMKQLTTARADEMAQGYTGNTRGALPMPIAGDEVLPADPTMRTVYAEVGKLYGKLSRGPIAAINQITKVQQGQINTGMPADLRRMSHNELERAAQRIYIDMAWVIEDLNKTIGQQLGGREVDVRNIDWKKGPEQFRMLQQQSE